MTQEASLSRLEFVKGELALAQKEKKIVEDKIEYLRIEIRSLEKHINIKKSNK